jgi:hypothetical protein
MPQTPLRYWLVATILIYSFGVHAQENDALPIDLIELLGELDDDDQASFEAAIKEFENKSAPAIKSQNNAEAGVKK